MGRNSLTKVVSGLSCPNVSIKHLHLKGISYFPLVKFEAAENIINSISASRVLFPDYVQIYTKTSKIIFNK